MGPILLRYWLAGKRRGESEAVAEERLKQLHRTYAPVAGRLMGELRGVFVKVAQVVSIAPGFVPEEYQREFRRLQDSVPPARWEDIRRVLETDLGAPLEHLFEEVRREPLGAASLGQAHLAKWRGRQVVLKVQYLDSKANLRADFDSMQAFVRLTKPSEVDMIKRIREQAEREVDYVQEARHLRTLHEAVASSPEFRGRVAVPAPVEELTRGRILGMEYLPGPRLDNVLNERLVLLGMDPGPNPMMAMMHNLTSEGPSTPAPQDAAGPERPWWQRIGGAAFQLVGTLLGPDHLLSILRAASEARLRCRRRANGGSSTHELTTALKALLEVHGFQIFFCPLFNADPHPGNILALRDGRVGLIDMGQCSSFDPAVKVHFARLLLLLLEPCSPEVEARIVETMLNMGVRTEKSDLEYLAFLPRLVLCKLKGEWFKDDYWKVMLKRDRIVEQPVALIMSFRVANLLRGFGLALLENVSMAESWRPWAERCLAETGEPV